VCGGCIESWTLPLRRNFSMDRRTEELEFLFVSRCWKVCRETSGCHTRPSRKLLHPRSARLPTGKLNEQTVERCFPTYIKCHWWTVAWYTAAEPISRVVVNTLFGNHRLNHGPNNQNSLSTFNRYVRTLDSYCAIVTPESSWSSAGRRDNQQIKGAAQPERDY